MLKKYYDILGIPEGASKTHIRKAYLKLVKKWHPDVNKSPRAKQKFIQIKKAYEVLISEKRVPQKTHRQSKEEIRKRRIFEIRKRAQAKRKKEKEEFLKSNSYRALRFFKLLLRIFMTILGLFILFAPIANFSYENEEDKGEVIFRTIFMFIILSPIAYIFISAGLGRLIKETDDI